MADGSFDLLQAQRHIFRSGLGAHARLVALAICDHWSREQREPFPSIARLASWTGLERKTVMRAIAELNTSGAVRVIDTKGRVNRYDLTPLMSLPVVQADQSPRGAGTPEGPVPETDGTGTSEGPPPVPERDTKEPREGTQEGTHGEASESAPPNAEPSKPGTKRPPKRCAPEVALPADWTPSEAHRAYAAKHGLDVELAADGMRGWAEGRTQVSWNGTFSTRLANQVNWNRQRVGSRRTPVQNGRWQPPGAPKGGADGDRF